MIYTVTFNPALDYVVRVENLKTGEVNRTGTEMLCFGGKGINVSAVLKALGEKSVALGFVAGFTGNALESGVRQMGIETDFITLPTGNTRINVKIKAQNETDINAGGPAVPASALDALMQKLDSLKSGDILCLSGSIQKALPQSTYATVLERLSGKDICFVVDAAGDLLLKTLKFKPFLIKPNHHELAEMLGRDLKTEAELFEGAQELQNRGARNVLVSRAGDGALLLTENGDRLSVGAIKGDVKNSVGAGDSMVAGFLAGYLQKPDYAYALRLGTAAGSATAFSDGLATHEQIAELFCKLN